MAALRRSRKGMHVHMADMQAHGYSGCHSEKYIASWSDLKLDAHQFVQEVMVNEPKEARFAFVSFSTGGAIAFELTSLILKPEHPLHGQLAGHFAMAPLTTNPVPGAVRVLAPMLACCCAKARNIPYTTDQHPWRSFANKTVYKLEVIDDKLNWGNGKDGKHAIGNMVVISAASAACLAALPVVVGKLPLKVVYGDRDGILPEARRDALELFDGLANTELDILPGAPHCLLQTPEGETLQTKIVDSMHTMLSDDPQS